MLFFLPLDHDSCAGHLVGGCDVKKQRLPLGGGYQDGGGVGEQSLELVKRLLVIGGLGEVLRFFKKPIQRQPFLSEARDEPAEGLLTPVN